MEDLKMQDFKKELLGLCKKSYTVLIILGIVVLFFVGLGAYECTKGKEPFDAMESGYASMDVTYLMGPFAEDSGSNGMNYYVAEQADGYWSIVGMKNTKDIPVYGEDVFDDDLDNLKSYTIKGKSESMTYDMKRYVGDFFEDAGAETVSLQDIESLFGTHYLDTSNTPVNTAIIFWIIAGIFFVIMLIGLSSMGSRKKKVKAQFKNLEQSGMLQVLYQDLSSARRITSKKYNLAIGSQYLLDFNSTQNGFDIVPLDGVNNVFECRMEDGEPSKFSFIALENVAGKRILTARTENPKQEYRDIIAQLKHITQMNGGTQW